MEFWAAGKTVGASSVMAFERLAEKGGKALNAPGLAFLGRRLTVPPALIEIMIANPLISLTLSVPEERDPSGLGVYMRWLNAEEMLSEAVDVYPGIVAIAWILSDRNVPARQW